MSLKDSTEMRNATQEARATLLSGGKLRLLDAASVLLAEMTLPTPFSAAAANGTITATTIADVTAAASGTASKAEFTKSDGTVLSTCGVGLTGSAEVVTLDRVDIQQGATVSIQSVSFTSGNA